MAFETFKRQRAQPSTEPTVTIQRKGVISLNVASFEALGEPEAVELLFDPDERRIGMRKIDPSVPHAYTVRSLGHTTWLVSGTAFTNYYAIETPVARRWSATMQDDILTIDLKTEGVEVTGNRKPTLQEASPQGSLLRP
jgi:hypothetical protein